MWLEPNSRVDGDAHIEGLAPCIVVKETGTVFDDMHDGDQKSVADTRKGGVENMHIVPHGNNQTWVVNAPFNPKDCTALVDFNVPGKPGPPPVSLTATPWKMKNTAG